MVLWLILGTMAAFGTLCALWALLGWLLPDGSCVMCCTAASAEDALRVAQRFRWLRWFGLIRWELALDYEDFDEAQRYQLQKLGFTVSTVQKTENGAGSI
jgi:hypothetical protein